MLFWYFCDYVIKDALEWAATRSVIITIHARKVQWNVPSLRVLQVALFADVMSTTLVATVNSPSTKRVLQLGGDHRSVDLATVRRTGVLIQVVTSRQDSVIAGYVPIHLEMTYHILLPKCVHNFVVEHLYTVCNWRKIWTVHFLW